MKPKLLLITCLLCWVPVLVQAAEPPDWLLGEWILDNELTVAAQATVKSGGFGGFGMGKPSVSIGGLPVPIPGGTAPAPAAGTARDPHVLHCVEMRIVMKGSAVAFDFVGVGKEAVKPGEDLGRVTKWNRKKLTSRYESTSRKVNHTFALQKDKTLMVTVKLKPNQGQAATYKRVFVRTNS